MTKDDKALSLVKAPEKDKEWGAIVNDLVSSLTTAELPDNVVRATEMMLSGWPTYKIGKELGVRTETVRSWLEKYPAMAVAVAEGRKALSKWRMAKMEQQFLTAVERSEEILELDLADKEINSKLVGTIAQHARYIIGLFAGQKVDVNIQLQASDSTLKARSDALDYLATELAKQRESDEPIEATYRVVTDQQDQKSRPLLDEEGNPLHGTLGVLDKDEDGVLCHVCGQRVTTPFKDHVKLTHKMAINEYEICFMLQPGSVAEASKGA